MSGLPKFLNLEQGIGVKSAHDEVTKAFKRYIDAVEPRNESANRKTTSRRRGPSGKSQSRTAPASNASCTVNQRL